MTLQTNWRLSREQATARGGMVAAKTGTAACAGVEILRQGGNAVDAAVATAFAAGVAEPWMNGIGGGGYMVVHRPGDQPAVVEYPMIAPAAATPELFPLSGGGADSGLFGWPAVAGQANITGYLAVAIPGTVAGLALALERFGTISLADAVAPAIAIAADGVPVTWHTTLTIARDLGTLRRFPATAAVFLDADGNPPVTLEAAQPVILRQPDLARTLTTIARDGARAFYEGSIAQTMVAHLRSQGAVVEDADFSGYQASVEPALTTDYRDYQIATIGGGTGGTTLVESLHLIEALGVADHPHNSPEALHAMTQAFRQAFADRFAYLADPAMVDVPLAALTDWAYAEAQANRFSSDRLADVVAGSAVRLGIDHGLAASMPGYYTGSHQMADGSTTHLSVIDRQGMAVSLTQTLLSLWGSRVTVPATGILLNNGMMWFDPEPGRPNSVAGGKRPLSNMAPALLLRDGTIVTSLGASGGRHIMNCNAQLLLNLIDHGMSMQEAISAPRIDTATADLFVSARIPVSTQERLVALGHRVEVLDETAFGGHFASPVGIVMHGDGRFNGGADPYYAPATAVGVELIP